MLGLLIQQNYFFSTSHPQIDPMFYENKIKSTSLRMRGNVAVLSSMLICLSVCMVASPPVRPSHFVLITTRKRSLGQGNIFAPFCHSVHSGVCLSACWDTP